ncbi:MAG: family transporter [Hyphomicrobiales bacterium]|nr:family transporter [Hyphomicrobiales bacterium]
MEHLPSRTVTGGPEDDPLPTAATSARTPSRLITTREMTTSQFEKVLSNCSRVAMVLVGLVVGVATLQLAQVILAPVFLAIVVGLMVGPLADWLERRGIVPALSAALVVLLLIGVIAGSVLLFAAPLSEWVAKGPAIWEKFRTQLINIKGSLESLASLQDQLKSLMGQTPAMTVAVNDSSPVKDIAFLAPAAGAQVLVFLVSLYFYVATRENIRISILSLCFSRAVRWRTAHIFSDVERKVSRFLVSVTLINISVGVAVSLMTWALGLPSPILWGALAAVLNYIPYVGQAIMAVVLLAVGFATQNGLEHILLPFGCYLLINFIEAQIITPQFLGRALTLNPFVVFLSISFWLWIWGPVGGFIAVPSLLILQSGISHILPTREVAPRRLSRRAADVAARQAVLTRAAEAIRAQAEAEALRQREIEAAKAPVPKPEESKPEVAKPKRAPRKRPIAGSAPATG